MNYYFVTWLNEVSSKNIFPCLVFQKDNWNDYGYKTLFNVFYYKNKTEHSNLGYYRIMHVGEVETNIPKEFTKLAEDFCSLGVSEEFYRNIFEADSQNAKKILLGLNDIALNKVFLEKYKDNEILNKSLLRGSSSELIIENAEKIVKLLLVIVQFLIKFFLLIINSQNLKI